MVVTGTTVTSVGTVPPKFSDVAGNEAVAGIVAVVIPLGIDATCELATGPAATVTLGAVQVSV